MMDDMTRNFDLDRFVDDLRALVGYQTIVCRNPDAFARARDWIRRYLATYYPRDARVAVAYLDILRKVIDREPVIEHSAGASNGRFYAAHGTHVLMTGPRCGGAHSRTEWVDTSSLPAYHDLVHRTVELVSDRARSASA